MDKKKKVSKHSKKNTKNANNTKNDYNKQIKYNAKEHKLITKIENTYNEKKKYMDDILPNKNLNIQIISKRENKMGIADDKKNILLVGEFNFFGIYQPSTNLWIWASSIPGVSQKIIKNVNKIKNLNYLFENDNSEIMNFYYQILTQDVVMVPESNLEYINKLLTYLSDDYMIFNPENQNNIQFIGLQNIKEKYYA
jgi:hypothetical protein